MTTKKLAKKYPSDLLALESSEENAVFLAVNHVDVLKIKGMEFYHLFLIILINDPNDLRAYYDERKTLFYNTETRDLQEHEVVYFNPSEWRENTLWETTISASSECAYDHTVKNLGNLIKVPNFDRLDNNESGKRVFVKKISSNDISVIDKILAFEKNYDNSLKYALIPEINKKGYNSNSFFRGALKYSGLINHLEVPSCFKSPGLSKEVNFISRPSS